MKGWRRAGAAAGEATEGNFIKGNARTHACAANRSMSADSDLKGDVRGPAASAESSDHEPCARIRVTEDGVDQRLDRPPPIICRELDHCVGDR